MPDIVSSHRVTSQHKKYKAACVPCSASKVKCPGGGPPCTRCADTHKTSPCHYSLAARIGKPPGSKNKKTLERLHRIESRNHGDDGAGSENAVQSRPLQDISFADELQMPHIPGDQTASSSLSHPNFLNPLQRTSSQAHTQPTSSAQNIFDSDWDKSCNGSGLPDINAAGLEYSDFWDFESASSGIVWSDVLEDGRNLPSPAPSQQPSPSPTDHDSPLSPDILFPDTSSPVSFDTVLARLEATVEDEASNCREPPGRQLMLCQCLRKYTDILCQLQTIEMRQHPVRADTLLTCTDLVLSTTKSQSRCAQCMYDSRVLMQLVMILQTIFNWIEGQGQGSLGSCIDVKATLGQHNLTEEESTFVKIALMSRAVRRMHMVLKTMMMSRVEQMSLMSRQKKQSRDGRMEVDIKNLEHSISALMQTSNKLSMAFTSR